MQIKTQSFTYNEKRSRNFQTVEVGITTTYELDKGENPDEALERVKNASIARVQELAEKEVQRFA